MVTYTEVGPIAERKTPSPSQQRAIEAPRGRCSSSPDRAPARRSASSSASAILIEHHGVDPARICAFTFTNKAAGEITHRLEDRLGRA